MTATPGPTYDFSESIVFVTGAARGLGRAVSLSFAQFGADIVAVDRCETPKWSQYELASRADLEETVAEIEALGAEAESFVADVTDEAAIADAVEQTRERFGRIDVLVNAAGVWHIDDALDLSLSDWRAVVETNLTGAWLCAKHAGKQMRARLGSGRIVNVGSTASLVGTPGSSHYAASKHGLVGLTKTLALELASDDVTVNLVYPTGMDTPLVENMRSELGEEPFERIADASGTMQLLDGEGLVPPAHVAAAVCWLASDAAAFITGETLGVDGGMTAK